LKLLSIKKAIIIALANSDEKGELTDILFMLNSINKSLEPFLSQVDG